MKKSRDEIIQRWELLHNQTGGPLIRSETAASCQSRDCSFHQIKRVFFKKHSFSYLFIFHLLSLEKNALLYLITFKEWFQLDKEESNWVTQSQVASAYLKLCDEWVKWLFMSDRWFLQNHMKDECSGRLKEWREFRNKSKQVIEKQSHAGNFYGFELAYWYAKDKVINTW